jgi:hypothetical protein
LVDTEGNAKAAAKVLDRESDLTNNEHYRSAYRLMAQMLRDETLNPKHAGQLYEVEIPDDKDMLLWDKPLSQQSEKVRATFKKAGLDRELKDNLSNYASPMDTRGKLKGENIYAFLTWKLGSEKAASKKLNEMGVLGINYPAGTIAGNTKSTARNYVVFSGDDVAIQNQFYQNNGEPRNELGFYSALAGGVDRLQIKAAAAAGWKEAIQGLVNKGIAKADEVEWTGINDWLDLQQGKVTKEQVAAYLQQGGVQVDEIVLSGEYSETKYGDDGLSLPGGGTNYREVLLRLPNFFNLTPGASGVITFPDEDSVENFLADVSVDGLENLDYGANEDDSGERTKVDFRGLTPVEFKQFEQIAELYDGAVEMLEGDEQVYAPAHRNSHWQEPNVVAHMRLNDRVDSDGKRVLFVEEIQSDWVQEGRESGFGTEEGNVAPAPFVTKTEGWLNLALKRIAIIAAEGGYDRVAFITGTQSADRYDLKSTRQGMVAFYDQIVPAAIKKLLPKVGGEKLGNVEIPLIKSNGEQSARRQPFQQPGFDVTDKMRQVVEGGLPLFQDNGQPRGSFSPSELTIRLTKAQNLSTFLHESGHFYLHMLASLASRPDAPADIKADADAVLDWLGVQPSPDHSRVDEWLSMSVDDQREMHETFARGFESYLSEGKAPSVELAGLFSRFRSWLMSVYRTLLLQSKSSDLGKALNAQLSPEVRAVFDRMLATEDEIRNAEISRSMGMMFASEAEAREYGVDWQAYQEQAQAATDEAISAMDAKSVRDMKWLGNARSRLLKQLQSEAKEMRRVVRMSARAEVLSQPVYRAYQFLTGKLSAEDKLELKPGELRKSKPGPADPTIDSLFVAIAKLGGLSRDQVQSEWGLDPTEKIPHALFGLPVVRASTEGKRSIDQGAMRAKEIDDMLQTLAQYGYFSLDENGLPWMADFEDAFDDELRGNKHYSNQYDPTNTVEEEQAGLGVDLNNLGAMEVKDTNYLFSGIGEYEQGGFRGSKGRKTFARAQPVIDKHARVVA